MECLFDPCKAHFRVWLALYDIDSRTREGALFHRFTPWDKSAAGPLYYAALCGFHDLVEHLITRSSQDVNADGGYYMRPLVAALAGEHFETADLLHHSGANLHVRGYLGVRTPMHSEELYGNLKLVQKLIEYKADIHAEDEDGWTPLYLATLGHDLKDGSVLRLLLEHGADVNVRTKDDGWTPLHQVSYAGVPEVVRLLLDHGADVEAKNNDGKTALQCASGRRRDEIVTLLRQHGAMYRVRGVADIALSVDRRVVGVGDQLTAVIDGAQYDFNQSLNTYLTPNVYRCTTSSRWRRLDGTFVVSELHSC